MHGTPDAVREGEVRRLGSLRADPVSLHAWLRRRRLQPKFNGAAFESPPSAASVRAGAHTLQGYKSAGQ
jgi:hypothetical protein